MKPTLKVTVTTAIELTKKQVNSILKAVEKNNIIELKQVVDPSVIGGIKITVGAEEIDATIYTKLEKLHNQLRKNT
jgi:F-type H+-transporting ATPase subunit delta